METITEKTQDNILQKAILGREETNLYAIFSELVAELHNRLVQENNFPEPLSRKSPLLIIEVDGFRYAVVCVGLRKTSEPTEVSLSPRELEIARLISKGLPNKAIASILEISPWTVATHLRRIYVKLDVNSRAEMVAKLMKAGAIGSLKRVL